jgi:hypothetical protein
MKSAEDLSRDLDAIKVALRERELSEAELGEIESRIEGLKQVVGSGSGKKRHSILELKGLGKEIWQSIDVDEYLREERRSWR